MSDSTAERFKGNEMMRAHVWGYFQLHAQQRLTTFNFYVVLSSVLTTALIAGYQKLEDLPLLPAAIGTLLLLFSFVFSRLDLRNKQLIRNAELAMENLEVEWHSLWGDGVVAKSAAVFSRDKELVDGARSRDQFLTVIDRHWSFSDCFRLAFLALGLLGAGSILVSLAAYVWLPA